MSGAESAGHGEGGFGPAERERVRSQLAKLLQAPGVESSARRKQLLTYLVEQALAGKGEQISEYGIGLDVFGRPPSFDPRLDSIVRTETSRLRQKLKAYYAEDGQSDRVVVEIPNRNYIPAIRFRTEDGLNGSGSAGAMETGYQPAGEAIPGAARTSGEVPPKGSPREFSWRPWLTAGTAIFVAAALAALALRAGWRFGAPAAPPAGSVAVLPFQNLSPDRQPDYLVDGITEELTNELAQWNDLRVVARTSAFQFKSKSMDIREIGRQLNAGAAIEGSVSSEDGRTRITAQLNRTSDGYHLWSRSYLVSPNDIAGVESEIATAVEVAMHGAKATMPPQHLSTNSPEAHDLYLQGNYQLAHQTPESEAAGLELFRRATAADPNYVAAYIGMARAEIGLIHFTSEDPEDGLERARSAAERAIQIDPTAAEAHGVLGFIDYSYDWNWPDAEREYRLAIEHGAQSMAHSLYGGGLATRGRFQEAQEQFRIAEDLDPLSFGPPFNQMLAFYEARQYDDALAVLHNVLKRNPDLLDAHLFVGLIAAIRHDCATADTEFTWCARKYSMPVTKFGLAVTCACRGDSVQARRYLSEMDKSSDSGFVSPYQLALGYAMLHDSDAVFAQLERSAKAHEGQILYLKVEPVFDELRGDPRYVAMERRVGLIE